MLTVVPPQPQQIAQWKQRYRHDELVPAKESHHPILRSWVTPIPNMPRSFRRRESIVLVFFRVPENVLPLRTQSTTGVLCVLRVLSVQILFQGSVQLCPVIRRVGSCFGSGGVHFPQVAGGVVAFLFDPGVELTPSRSKSLVPTAVRGASDTGCGKLARLDAAGRLHVAGHRNADLEVEHIPIHAEMV